MSSWKPGGKGGSPLQSVCFEKDPGLQGAREKLHQYQAGAEAQEKCFLQKHSRGWRYWAAVGATEQRSETLGGGPKKARDLLTVMGS